MNKYKFISKVPNFRPFLRLCAGSQTNTREKKGRTSGRFGSEKCNRVCDGIPRHFMILNAPLSPFAYVLLTIFVNDF